jgi:hypothetical protein
MWQNCTMLDSVSSCITHVLLMQIGQNKIDKQCNAVCITPNPSYMCWLLCDFSNHSEDIPYILDSNPHPFCSFRGLKNQMRIRIVCGLDSRSRAGFWKSDRAAVRAVRTIQYFIILFIIYNIIYYIIFIIYYSSDSLSSLITESLSVTQYYSISLPCRQGGVEGKVRIRTTN